MLSWSQKNIRFLYFYIFASGLYFDRALWVLYLGERGMNMGQVGVLEALLHFMIVFFEVPTGMVADLYGRKKSLLIGQIISIGYALFMMISGNFFLFTLAFALMGLGNTFKSGAEQALLYDTLQASGEEKLYTKITGNTMAIILVSMSLAKWVGGLMAEHSWNIVYLSIIASQFLGLWPILFLKEPPRPAGEQPPAKRTIREAWRTQFFDSLGVWKSEKSVRLPIINFIAVTTVITVVIFYAQEHFSRQGFSTSEIGLIFTIESLLGALVAKLAHHVEERAEFGKLFLLLYYLFVGVLLVFSLVTGLLGVLALFFLGMLDTLLSPIFSNFIQGKITSNIRATFFSMISLLTSLAIMILFPLFGAVVDRIGFSYSFLGLVGLLLVLGLSSNWKMARE